MAPPGPQCGPLPGLPILRTPASPGAGVGTVGDMGHCSQRAWLHASQNTHPGPAAPEPQTIRPRLCPRETVLRVRRPWLSPPHPWCSVPPASMASTHLLTGSCPPPPPPPPRIHGALCHQLLRLLHICSLGPVPPLPMRAPGPGTGLCGSPCNPAWRCLQVPGSGGTCGMSEPTTPRVSSLLAPGSEVT